MKPSLTFMQIDLYRIFIAPKTLSAETRRRELILNVLLCSLSVISSLAVLVGLYYKFVAEATGGFGLLVAALCFWAGTIVLIWVSHIGYITLASSALVMMQVGIGAQLMLAWGYHFAIAQLVLLLATVVAGVLLTGRGVILVAISIVGAISVVTYLQATGYSNPSLYWLYNEPHFGDIIGFIFITIALGIVTWLSNRETQRSLRRAQKSEQALQLERDKLEEKVIARTQELEDLQLQRLLEIQPFAELGRIGANLVHEIANPLTAAMLHLQEYNRNEVSKPLLQVQRNLNQLERYLLAARKQIKRQSDLRDFAVSAEARQVVRLLTNRARKAGVQLQYTGLPGLRVYGDTVKFSQIIANLLANAIDATVVAGLAEARVVKLEVDKAKNRVIIAITDFGAGIPADAIEHLFKPFYTTKSTDRAGLGIGLALVKQYVSHDFMGDIIVTSTRSKGTTFRLELPLVRNTFSKGRVRNAG